MLHGLTTGRVGRMTLAVIFLVTSVRHAVAQGRSDEGAPFLLLPVGADAIALGRAMTAMPGPGSAFWNPAGLATLGRSQVVLHRGDGPAGTSTAASVLFARPGIGTVGVSYLLLDMGTQDNTDVYDNLLGTISFRDRLAVFSAAARLFPGVDAGVNFKVFQSGRSCRGTCADVGTTSTGYAVDAGIQVVPLRGVPLRLGVAAIHMGPPFQLENAAQADPLPTRVRVAAAYDFLHRLQRAGLQGWVTVEAQKRPGDSTGPFLYVGAELVAGEDEVLYLRAGYAAATEQPGGPSVGLALKAARMRISVARALARSILEGSYEPIAVSLSINF